MDVGVEVGGGEELLTQRGKPSEPAQFQPSPLLLLPCECDRDRTEDVSDALAGCGEEPCCLWCSVYDNLFLSISGCSTNDRLLCFFSCIYRVCNHRQLELV